MKRLSEEIADWIRIQVEKANKKGAVVGLSGGIDSSCVAVLSKKALGSNVLGLILPCNSNPRDEELALKVARKFGIETRKIPLNNIFNGLVSMYPEGSDIAKANLKPRLRMAILYYFANTLDYLVAGTGNKSELCVGYFTKYGDGGVDILPLGGLLKTEVRKLAKYLGVPDEIIERQPTAGLWVSQTDEAEMGITYDELDKVLAIIEKKRKGALDKVCLLKVKRMIKNSKHKRNKLPVFIK
ncbi:MAG: NAD(+) synthase [Elusimicrobiota bacterium]|nr:NAD(+) synthase [Elusimicrobiota bacterium]